MNIVISALSAEELKKMPYHKRKTKVGVMYNGDIIVPPVCPSCGGECLRIEMDGKYLQCVECSSVYKEHEFRSLNIGDLNETNDGKKCSIGR